MALTAIWAASCHNLCNSDNNEANYLKNTELNQYMLFTNLQKNIKGKQTTLPPQSCQVCGSAVVLTLTIKYKTSLRLREKYKISGIGNCHPITHSEHSVTVEPSIISVFIPLFSISRQILGFRLKNSSVRKYGMILLS